MYSQVGGGLVRVWCLSKQTTERPLKGGSNLEHFPKIQIAKNYMQICPPWQKKYIWQSFPVGNGIKTNRMEPKQNVDLTLIPLVTQGSNQKPHSFKQGSLQITCMSLFLLMKNPVIFLCSVDYFIFPLAIM